jgi:hypothetical protein
MKSVRFETIHAHAVRRAPTRKVAVGRANAQTTFQSYRQEQAREEK